MAASPPNYPLAPAAGEVAKRSFDGAVVRVVDATDGRLTPDVQVLGRARVVLTDRRLVARTATSEWSWLFRDVQAVRHGGRDPWSVLEVPGVTDFGVAVAVDEADEFRRTLEHEIPGTSSTTSLRPEVAPLGDGSPVAAQSEHWDREPEPPATGSGGTPQPGADWPGGAAAEPGAHPGGSWPASVAASEPAPEPGGDCSVPVVANKLGHAPGANWADAETAHGGPPGGDNWAVPGWSSIKPPRRRRLPALPGFGARRSRSVTRAGTSAPLSVPEVSGPTAGGPGLRQVEERPWLSARDPSGAAKVARPLAGLEARDISAWFGDRLVLDRVSLSVPAGGVTALIGPSGCGKSTFLRILNRMHELIPSASLAGEVLLDGQDIYEPTRKLTDARRQVGMVFQKPNPFPAMSIYDNVIAGLKLTGTVGNEEAKDALVESCLVKAGLWKEVRDRLRQPGGALSGGQQQRLCIARALAIRPRVLLMDEPCSALDPTSTRRIEQTIGELVSEVTIVIVTHNMQQAARVSNQCAFFLAEQGTPGVIVEHGPTDAMFHSPQDQRTSDYVEGRFG